MKIQEGTYYAWIGGSCDYGHKERAGGAAYILEKDGLEIDRYVTSELGTTEFRMMLKVMEHVMWAVPEGSEIVFLTNVSYLQNFDREPSEKTVNADLIRLCILAKGRLASAEVKILPYHKYERLLEVHEMARAAMSECRGHTFTSTIRYN